MIRNAARAIRATVALALLTGLLYPLVMTGVAQVAFRGKADGSLIHTDGRTVGSSLIGQAWTGPQWFYGRPSATYTPYDASASSGSNLGPLSRPLAEDVRARIDAILKIEGPYHQGLVASDIPVDLVTSSASGLDPDISPAAARFQAPRIAAVRGISLAAVVKLIDQHTESRTLGVLGEPRVNVLELNLALERSGQG
jgi:potassium-transporting ATPase KdpC subunit